MRYPKTLFAAAIVVASLLVLAAPGRAQDGTPRAVGDMFLEVDDLVTATGQGDFLIRLRPRKNGKGYQARRLRVRIDNQGVRLTPKAITSNKNCEKIAIANAHNVVTVDVWSGAVRVIDHPDFGEIADVQYDWDCNLIIADMGGNAVGKTPKDGRLWRYGTDGSLVEIAWRQDWSNPAFLDMDEGGTLYVVDKGAGPKMPGNNGWHFDAIYKLGAPKYSHATLKYGGPGLNVSAFVHHPAGLLILGNQDELLVLDGNLLFSPCEQRFLRINGLALDTGLDLLFLVDGFDVFGTTSVYTIDSACDVKTVRSGRIVKGAQGLTAGLPGR